MNVRTLGPSTLLSGVLCAALLAGCGDSDGASPPESAVISAKGAVKATTDGTQAAGEAASAQGAKAGAAMETTAADAAAKAGDALSKAAADAEAALAAVPSQEEADMAASKEITEANADAEFEKLMKEIDKDDGK